MIVYNIASEVDGGARERKPIGAVCSPSFPSSAPRRPPRDDVRDGNRVNRRGRNQPHAGTSETVTTEGIGSTRSPGFRALTATGSVARGPRPRVARRSLGNDNRSSSNIIIILYRVKRRRGTGRHEPASACVDRVCDVLRSARARVCVNASSALRRTNAAGEDERDAFRPSDYGYAVVVPDGVNDNGADTGASARHGHARRYLAGFRRREYWEKKNIQKTVS